MSDFFKQKLIKKDGWITYKRYFKISSLLFVFLMCMQSYASTISETVSGISEGEYVVRSTQSKRQVLLAVDKCIEDKLKKNLSPLDCGQKPNLVSNTYLNERVDELQKQIKIAGPPPMCEGMEYLGCSPEHRAAVLAAEKRVKEQKRKEIIEWRRQCPPGRCN